jgi:charged multivesicular body protein 3
MFGKRLPPDQQAKEWKASVRAQKRTVERQIRHIEMEENRIKAKIAPLIKQGQTDAAMPLVQSIAQSRKARSNLLKTCTQLDSLVRNIDLQLAQLKVTGCFKQSTDVMHMMNQMVRLPEIQEAAQRMNMEMQQAGLIGEMVDDAFDSAMDQESPEDQELAVRLMYNEIAGQINKTAAKPVALLPVNQAEIDADPAAAALVTG